MEGSSDLRINRIFSRRFVCLDCNHTDMKKQPQFYNEDDWKRERRNADWELALAVTAFMMIPVFLLLMGWIAYHAQLNNW